MYQKQHIHTTTHTICSFWIPLITFWINIMQNLSFCLNKNNDLVFLTSSFLSYLHRKSHFMSFLYKYRLKTINTTSHQKMSISFGGSGAIILSRQVTKTTLTGEPLPPISEQWSWLQDQETFSKKHPFVPQSEKHYRCISFNCNFWLCFDWTDFTQNVSQL